MRGRGRGRGRVCGLRCAIVQLVVIQLVATQLVHALTPTATVAAAAAATAAAAAAGVQQSRLPPCEPTQALLDRRSTRLTSSLQQLRRVA